MIKKRKLCIVHIGMPKTGSTTLQNTFFAGIADPKFSYGRLPHPNHSGWLYSLFSTAPLGYHFLDAYEINSLEKLESFKNETRNRLIESFLDHSADIEILSGEDLYHLDAAGINRLKAFLEEYFTHITIVAYIRPVKSFLESAFQQLVKYHGQASFDHQNIYHPFNRIKRYDDVFGVKNVMLLKFQPESFPEGDIVLDFCDNLGLPPMKATQKIANESISAEALSLLFTYNAHPDERTHFGAANPHVNNILVDKFRTFGSERFRLSRHFVQMIIDKNQDDYSWMQARLDNFDLEQGHDGTGFSSAEELMDYATQFIGDLLAMVDTREIDFDFVRHPRTVAKLVNLLARQIHRGLAP